ncbi:MAG: alpha/beta hydrolase [Anaerolineales bacterium]|nr:alpha/beta hydrolase [Anaerolineales bacterium]
MSFEKILDQPITKKEILQNEQVVSYVQQGEGSPVILTHGLAASLHDWDDLLPELAESGYAGYALDLLGHGESCKPASPHDYTFASVFEHFAAWIDLLQINEPMTLIGHSLGGGLVLQYALRYPNRVRALALVNPFYDLRQLPPFLRFAFRRQLVNTALIDRTPYRLFRLVVDVTNFNFHIGQHEPHSLPEHIRYQTALDYKRASSGIYNIPRSLPDFVDDLPRINQPALLLWGKRDQTLASDSFPRIAHLLPNIISSHVFPICGHVPHQCHADEFNPHVMGFLKNL